VDGTDVVKFPGVLIFLRKGEVSGGTDGTTFDHAGFWVPNGQEFVLKLKAAGVKADPTTGAPRKADYHGYSWGVKFDKPFTKSHRASYASAEITDPWERRSN
jgi:hypothetical protein